METRLLGRSDLNVSVLSFGTATFGGTSEVAQRMGALRLPEASRLIDMCIEAGVNLFDTADIYAEGEAEELLGKILHGKRNRVLIATKAFGRTGAGVHDAGSSRRHLLEACDASLKRLGTDWIDVYQLHGFDALTPLEETARALEDLVRWGKVRQVGCSNFAAWQLMKALSIADREGLTRFASHQLYYSLVGRDAEHELIPVSLDQDVGVLVWGPLASGLLSGKFTRGEAFTADTRMSVAGVQSLFELDKAFDVIETAREIASMRGVSVAQVALNWLLAKRGVTTIILGARTGQQLSDNLGAAQWRLSRDEIERLDAASAVRVPYPLWHQRSVYQLERNPLAPSVRDEWSS